MAAWGEIEQAVPELAAAVRERFEVRKHATLATLRSDGGPRISGTEVECTGGELWLGSMPGAVKARDLQRDPRFALHSPTVDPPPDDPGAWPGEAKLSGVAIETSHPAEAEQPHRFRLEVREVVLTRVVDGRLQIQSWQDGRGYRVISRD